MLGHADAVGIGDLGDGDPTLDRRFQINVVRADPRRDSEVQPRRLRDPLSRQVGRPERLGDDDLSVRELSLEDGVRPVLVRRDNKRVATLLEEPPQPELPGNAAQKLTRLEVDPLGGRRGPPIVVAPLRERSSRGRTTTAGTIRFATATAGGGTPPADAISDSRPICRRRMGASCRARLACVLRSLLSRAPSPVRFRSSGRVRRVRSSVDAEARLEP